jgi:hypothetical protein
MGIPEASSQLKKLSLSKLLSKLRHNILFRKNRQQYICISSHVSMLSSWNFFQPQFFVINPPLHLLQTTFTQ